MAVIKKDVPMVEHILARGADTEIVYRGLWHREEEKRTNQIALHFAMKYRCRVEDDETVLVRLLLRHGKGSLSKQDSLGSTPIHAAVKSKWLAGLDMCLRSATAVEINIRDKEGIDALTYANGAGDQKMADLIRARLNRELSSNTDRMQNLKLQQGQDGQMNEGLTSS